MLTFRFSGADGVMVESETLTSGMTGKRVKLEFSSDWENLKKTAVFTAGPATKDVLDIGDEVVIPHEVLQNYGDRLYVGIFGVADDENVTPTIYARGPRIARGADPSDDSSTDPTLPVWAQLEARIDELPGQNTSGIHIGPEPPVDTSFLWIDTDDDTEDDAHEGCNSIALTGATVGQIAKITAVDENGVPTAWEAVDMPSGGEEWVSLAEVVTTENVNSIVVSFDACKAVKGYFVYGAVESDLGRIGILPNVSNPNPYIISETRYAIYEFVTSSNNKVGVVTFNIDTRETVVWRSTCSTHFRSDSGYRTDITDVRIPDGVEIGTSLVSESIITNKYMESKELEDGVLSICVYGAGMVKGTKLFLWGLKK